MAEAKPLYQASPIKTCKGTVLTRSRLGVGKAIGGDLYLHQANAHLLPDQGILNRAKALLPTGFVFNVIKVSKTGALTFFASPDFDTAEEPTAGPYVRVGPTGAVKAGQTTNLWHHKWLWVADNYAGFDVEASKQRSRSWLALLGVDSAKIGHPTYWLNEVVPRIPAE